MLPCSGTKRGARLTGVHWSGSDSIDRDLPALQLLGDTTREMLDRGLGARICGIEAREGSEKGGDKSDDLAAILDMLGSSLEDEEGRLGVHPGASQLCSTQAMLDGAGQDSRCHFVILRFRNLGNGLFQDFAHRINDNIDLAEISKDRRKELINTRGSPQIALVKLEFDIWVQSLENLLRLCDLGLGLCRVVVQGEVCAKRSKLLCDLPAEVLDTPGDDGGFALERHDASSRAEDSLDLLVDFVATFIDCRWGYCADSCQI